MRSIGDDLCADSQRDDTGRPSEAIESALRLRGEEITPVPVAERTCPGCGVRMQLRPGATNDTDYNASPECWSVYTEVLGAEYSHAEIFGQVHQLTVDAYAVQHAGGSHPDKSIAIHLTGLHLTKVRGIKPPNVPPMLQRIGGTLGGLMPYRSRASRRIRSLRSQSAKANIPLNRCSAATPQAASAFRTTSLSVRDRNQ